MTMHVNTNAICLHVAFLVHRHSMPQTSNHSAMWKWSSDIIYHII